MLSPVPTHFMVALCQRRGGGGHGRQRERQACFERFALQSNGISQHHSPLDKHPHLLKQSQSYFLKTPKIKHKPIQELREEMRSCVCRHKQAHTIINRCLLHKRINNHQEPAFCPGFAFSSLKELGIGSVSSLGPTDGLEGFWQQTDAT